MDYECAIVGAGAAGLTAAIYAARAGIKTVLLEKYFAGGQIAITDMIENYPGFPDGITGPELVEKMKQQAEKFGVPITNMEVELIEKIENGFELNGGGKILTAETVIVASGASPRKIEVGREEALIGKGISYCATCDGYFFRGKDVLVAGGGDAAVQESLFLTDLVNSVTIIHRRDRLRAHDELQKRAFNNDKIKFVWNSIIVELIGEEKLSAVKVRNVETGKESIIETEGLFIFIGHIPNSGFLKGLVELDEHGHVITNPDYSTTELGIWACGDVRHNTARQIVSSAGEGATAALAVHSYISNRRGTAYV